MTSPEVLAFDLLVLSASLANEAAQDSTGVLCQRQSGGERLIDVFDEVAWQWNRTPLYLLAQGFYLSRLLLVEDTVPRNIAKYVFGKRKMHQSAEQNVSTFD